jgi:Xaa-Pro aminopeptidase
MGTFSDTSSLFPRFSDEEFFHRYQAVRQIMAATDLAAIIVYGQPGFDAEVQYLSHFPVSREGVLVFPAEGEPTLFLQYFNHLPTARQLTVFSDVRWGGPNTIASIVEHVHERGLAARRLGIAGSFPAQRLASLQQALPHATFADVTGALLDLRLIKSQEELAFMRRGAAFSDLAMEALEHQVHAGMSELELAAIVEGAYLGLGGKTHIHYMATTPMSQPTVCVPAQHLSQRVIEQGDVLMTEISALYYGYAGQILRPFTIGMPPTAEYQRLYEVAVEAFSRLAAVLRDGATSEELQEAAEYIHLQGFTVYDDLVHGFGPGAYYPSLRTRRTSARPPQLFVFRENMTVVIQPNIITEDERMGVQVGELLRVTRDGVESLHTYPMRFVQCG